MVLAATRCGRHCRVHVRFERDFKLFVARIRHDLAVMYFSEGVGPLLSFAEAFAVRITEEYGTNVYHVLGAALDAGIRECRNFTSTVLATATTSAITTSWGDMAGSYGPFRRPRRRFGQKRPHRCFLDMRRRWKNRSSSCLGSVLKNACICCVCVCVCIRVLLCTRICAFVWCASMRRYWAHGTTLALVLGMSMLV